MADQPTQEEAGLALAVPSMLGEIYGCRAPSGEKLSDLHKAMHPVLRYYLIVDESVDESRALTLLRRRRPPLWGRR